MVKGGTTVRVCVYVEVRIQLRGDARSPNNGEWLYESILDPWPTDPYCSRFYKRRWRISVTEMQDYYENKDLRKRLEDLAKTIPTAPPGTYQIMMKVFISLRIGMLHMDAPLKRLSSHFLPHDEVFVEINEPKDGSYFNNLAPTFSWTTSEPSVRVSVYEAGVNHRSPQDALTGSNPYLILKSYSENGNPADFSGTSLTYPSNAQRQLQQDKAFVLRVEARVQTNRGPIMRPSRPVVFRITDDKVGKMLDNFLNTLSSDISSPYTTLRSDPTDWVYWSQYGNTTLNGRTLTETDLQTLLNELAAQTDLKLQLSVENH